MEDFTLLINLKSVSDIVSPSIESAFAGNLLCNINDVSVDKFFNHLIRKITSLSFFSRT